MRRFHYDQWEMARDSVRLSNERTFLSYVRTSLALVGAALIIFRFAPFNDALIFGPLTFTIALLFFFWGLHSYRTMEKKISAMHTGDAAAALAKANL